MRSESLTEPKSKQSEHNMDGQGDCPACPINRISYLRKQRGLTQRELADAARINIRHVQRLESGEAKINNASIETGLLLAKALGVKVVDLL